MPPILAAAQKRGKGELTAARANAERIADKTAALRFT